MSIHYIVCFYLGHRRSVKFNQIIDQDKTFFLSKHLEFLRTCGPEVTEATFVVNGEMTKDFFEFVVQNAPSSVKLNVASRDNLGFSYGAWNDVIVDNINKQNYHDYYFMIEDDYIPSCANFYEPFIEKCTNESPFVCCKLSPSNIDGKLHPAISNGIIQGLACQQLVKKYGHIFDIAHNNISYDSAYLIQTYYLKDFEKEGFGISDLTEKYCFPFHDSGTDTISNHGNSTGEKLIIPLL